MVASVNFYRGKVKAFETVPLGIIEGPNSRSKAVPIRFRISMGDLQPGRHTCQVNVINPSMQKFAVWRASKLTGLAISSPYSFLASLVAELNGVVDVLFLGPIAGNKNTLVIGKEGVADITTAAGPSRVTRLSRESARETSWILSSFSKTNSRLPSRLMCQSTPELRCRTFTAIVVRSTVTLRSFDSRTMFCCAKRRTEVHLYFLGAPGFGE